jgi:hypothetical protein
MSYKLVPILASPGEDKQLGLNWMNFAPLSTVPTDPVSKHPNDNVYSDHP